MTAIDFEDLDEAAQRIVRERLGTTPDKIRADLLTALGIGPERLKRHYSYGESRIQRAFIARVRTDPRTRDLVIAAVPNGARRSKIQGGRLKAEGMLAGYPDVLVDVACGGYHGLRFEFKQPGGKTSLAQGAVGMKLMAAGYCVFLVDEELTAFEVLIDYLNGTIRREMP